MSHWEYPLMRNAGSLLAEVVAVLHEHVVPGVTPIQIDHVAEEEIRRRGCFPAFKGYRVNGLVYQHTVCISVNNQVVHGIPNDRKFEIDDVVSVDVGLSCWGYYADMAFTVVLGLDQEALRLAATTTSALQAGIFAARAGNRIGDIGSAVQCVAEEHGFGVVTALTGHGIGRALHEHPAVPNFGRAGRGRLIKPGMAFAIEPMFTLGSPEVQTLDDGWTIVTNALPTYMSSCAIGTRSKVTGT